LRTTSLNITAYTDSLRLIGTIKTHHRRLTDLLTQEGVDVLSLDDCLVISLDNEMSDHPRPTPRGVTPMPQASGVLYEEVIEPLTDKMVSRVYIRRTQLLFAIQGREFDPGQPGQAQSEFRVRVTKEQHAMRAIVGGWDIRGYLHFNPDIDLAEAIRSQRSGFVPMTDAYALYFASDRLRLGPETLIVQRERIEALWSVEDES
jgi:hypothetical protein